MNGLRLIDGVPADLYQTRTGQALATLEPALAILQTQELLLNQPDRLQTTALGMRYLNTVLEYFLVE